MSDHVPCLLASAPRPNVSAFRSVKSGAVCYREAQEVWKSQGLTPHPPCSSLATALKHILNMIYISLSTSLK